ncbi:MAG: O-antigen ligase family protein [Solirubrobacterales bacterium]
MSVPTAPAEHPTASPGSTAPLSAVPRVRIKGARPGRPSGSALWWPTLLTAGVLCFVAFLAGGGLNLAHMTTVEMALTIGSSVLIAGTVLFARASPRSYGAWPAALLVAFTALTTLSVVWSVQPDDSWQDAGRMLAYSAFFAAAVALVRAAPGRWPAVLGGVILAAVVVCGYALLTKVFPDQLDASDVYARLRAPYSYWNAIGLTAAMGAIGCIWLGARRAGHALLSALAYPAMGLMLLTLMLAYSRGALIALALGMAVWLCIVPIRLRGAAVLLVGAAGATGVVAWDFSTHAISSDNVALGARTAAGHQLGALIVAMLILLTLAGLLIGFCTSRQAPSMLTRRRAGALLLSILAFAIVGFVGALAASHRGLSGSVSHAFHSLTDPNARVPNTPGRLTAVSSVRARYWKEALKVFKAQPVLGAGAEGYATARLRYRTAPIEVRHAHGYVVQTLADLGLLGLALTLALLAAWMAAAGRSTHPFNRRWSGWRSLGDWRSGIRPRWRHRPMGYTPERVGMLTMLSIVVVFGIHSLVDWTWYVPGDACVALLCAGWLAGRGPLMPHAEELSAPRAAAPAGAFDPLVGRSRSSSVRRPSADSSARVRVRWLGPMRTDLRSVAIACAAVIAALLAAWAQWQPQRSMDASQRALALLSGNPRAAQDSAQAAADRDPLSAQALFTLSTVQRATGQRALARATLQRAVRLQPSNPQTWLALGEYDLSGGRASGPSSAADGGAGSALSEISAAVYLNPQSIAPGAIARGNPEAIRIQNDYVEALRASTATPTRVKAAPRRSRPPVRSPRKARRRPSR